MNTTIIIFVIFIVIVSLYGIFSFHGKEQDVFTTEAGPTNCDETLLQKHDRCPVKTILLPNGTYKSSRDFIRIRINGHCMEKRGVCYGEEWLVEKIDKSKPFKEQVKTSDILFIYIKDKKIFKIRELRSFVDDERLDTIYYQNDIEKSSSIPHNIDSVLGIVRYNI